MTLNSEPFAWDIANLGSGRFHILYEGRSFNAEVVEIDYAIVRGLAYYTGVVFEVFDRSKKERALSGGGRYDKLLSLMSDGKVDLPALGFGMGDVVFANLIHDTPAAKALLDAWLANERACDVYVVLAK